MNVANVDAETQSYTDTARESRRDTQTSVCRCAVRPSHYGHTGNACNGVRVPRKMIYNGAAVYIFCWRTSIDWEFGYTVGLEEIIWHQREQQQPQQHRPIHSERQKYVVGIGVAVMACDLYVHMNIYLISSHRIVSHGFLLSRAHTHSRILIFLFSSSWLLRRPRLHITALLPYTYWQVLFSRPFHLVGSESKNTLIVCDGFACGVSVCVCVNLATQLN